MTERRHRDTSAAGSGGGESTARQSDAYLTQQAQRGEPVPFDILAARHTSVVGGYARRLVAHHTTERGGTTDSEPAGAAEAYDPQHLVQETFTGIRTGLQAGRGRDLAFRVWALMSLRDVYVDQVRRSSGLETAEALGRVPDTATRRAFLSLPVQAQVVLWHTTVDGEAPERVAPLLGLAPEEVPDLVSQGLSTLRERCAAEASPEVSDPHCDAAIRAMVDSPDRTNRKQAKAHLTGCHGCRMVSDELAALDQDPGTRLAYAVLGDAAGPYLGKGGPPRARGGIGRVIAGVATVRDTLRAHPARVVTVAAVVGVVVAATLVITSMEPPVSPPRADAPPDAPPAPVPQESSPSTSPTPSPSGAASSGSPSASGSASPQPTSSLPLEITSARQESTVGPGGLVRLIIGVRNTGTTTADKLRLALRLPEGFSFHAQRADDGWWCWETRVGISCGRMDLTAGTATTAAVWVEVARGTTGTHTVRISIRERADEVTHDTRNCRVTV